MRRPRIEKKRRRKRKLVRPRDTDLDSAAGTSNSVNWLAMDRRTFILTTAASQSRILGPNDRIRATIIGAGGRGRYLTAQFKDLGVEMAGVCDIYEPNLQAGLKEASTGAKSFTDYRKALEDKSMDAVIVATPDHWHSRMVIDAVEAGKDVYVEKPMPHTLNPCFTALQAVHPTIPTTPT